MGTLATVLLILLVMVILVAVVTAVMMHSHNSTVKHLGEAMKAQEDRLVAKAEADVSAARTWASNEVAGLKLKLANHAAAIKQAQGKLFPPAPVVEAPPPAPVPVPPPAPVVLSVVPAAPAPDTPVPLA